MKKFKTKILIPSSTEGDKDVLDLHSSIERDTIIQSSEISKPLSPYSSQPLSPEDGGPFDYNIKKTSIERESTKSKNNVKFKEDNMEYGEEEGSILPAEELKVNE